MFRLIEQVSNEFSKFLLQRKNWSWAYPNTKLSLFFLTWPGINQNCEIFCNVICVIFEYDGVGTHSHSHNIHKLVFDSTKYLGCLLPKVVYIFPCLFCECFYCSKAFMFMVFILLFSLALEMVSDVISFTKH